MVKFLENAELAAEVIAAIEAPRARTLSPGCRLNAGSGFAASSSQMSW
jgi:hypothetical protein